MQCPFCAEQSQTSDTQVTETRHRDGRVKRRRKCKECERPFPTTEHLDQAFQVRKTDGTVEPFDHVTLHDSVERAAVKSFSDEDRDRLVHAVTRQVYPENLLDPVPTLRIGEAVLAQLRRMDPVSHVRYAMVFEGRLDLPDRKVGFWDAYDFLVWLHQAYSEHFEESLPPQPARVARPQLAAQTLPSGPQTVVKRRRSAEQGDPPSQETFDRAKFVLSLVNAAKGRCADATSLGEFARATASAVLQELEGQSRVATWQLSAEVLKFFRRHDDIAYLRFASIAKRFTTVRDYQIEALELLKGRRRKA